MDSIGISLIAMLVTFIFGMVCGIGILLMSQFEEKIGFPLMIVGLIGAVATVILCLFFLGRMG